MFFMKGLLKMGKCILSRNMEKFTDRRIRIDRMIKP